MNRFVTAVFALAALAGSASAQVDGTYKGSYGGPLSVQQNATGFGDSNLGQVGPANGSELDAAYCNSAGGIVNLLFTGNLESNFNKFVLFIDSGTNPAAQNTITGTAGLDAKYNGFTFDPGFAATHWLILNGNGTDWFVDGGVFGGPGGFMGQNNGQGGGVLGGGTNFLGAMVAINNSNVVGVTGGSAAGALSAVTGVEVSLPLAALGLISANFKVTAFINGSGHDYASNQFLGSLPGGTGNLGGDGNGNFTGTISGDNLAQFAGDQFFVVPVPGTLALLGLGGLAAARRRR